MAGETPRRNTRQRQVVLEELRKLESHPTAAELYELARRRLPRISLGTVYRNLELLVQMGVIRKVETTAAESRFDSETDRHHHVHCVCCGQVADARELPEDPANWEIENVNGYEIHGFRLDFVGVCPDCQQKRSCNCEVSPAQRAAHAGANAVSALRDSGVGGRGVNSPVRR